MTGRWSPSRWTPDARAMGDTRRVDRRRLREACHTWAEARDSPHPWARAVAVHLRHDTRESGHRLEWRWWLDSSRASRRGVPHAHGFFVIGFDVKAYLSGFTSRDSTLRTEEEPGDYRVLAEFATKANRQEADPHRRFRGRRPLGARRDGPRHEGRCHGRHRPRTSEPERARLAVEGHDDLPDSQGTR